MPNLFVQLANHDEDDPGVTPAPLAETDALAFLQSAEITASKLIPWGSNYSFAVALDGVGGCSRLAIYKPRDGEAPALRLPRRHALPARERRLLLSRWLGWDLVPPTVIRDGPHGVGSVQLYVEPVPDGRDYAAVLGRARTRRSSGWSSSTTSPTTPTARSATACAIAWARSGASTTV